MMIRTCILVQIVGQCAVRTTKQVIALNRYMSKKNSEVFSWGLTRILDSIILRKAQGQILSVVVDSIRLAEGDSSVLHCASLLRTIFASLARAN